MDAAEFRAALARLGLSQSAFARTMHRLGDPREPSTILRSVANWARGVTAPPGEVCVVIRLLEQAGRSRRRSAERRMEVTAT